MIYPIVKYPDPVLTQMAAPITVFDKSVAKLADDMFDSMYAAEGIGLAAPQIGILKRITVIDTSFGKDANEKLVLINPEIVAHDGRRSRRGRLPVAAGHSRQGGCATPP